MRSVLDRVFVAGSILTSLLLCGTALAHHRSDQHRRGNALRFATRFELGLRRPEMLHAIRLAPSGDHALAVAAEAAVRDATEEVRVGSLDATRRRAWLANARSQEEELLAATSLALDAAAARPGSATRWAALGEVAFLHHRKMPSEEVALWIAPLTFAAGSAPNREATFRTLGGAYLERWNDVSERDRVLAESVLKRAFHDAGFTARAFTVAVDRIGIDRALRLVPEQAGPLRAVYASVARGGDARLAMQIARRFERAEYVERENGLREIQERVRRLDREGAQRACVRWASRHPVRESADREGLRQAAMLLELWPEGGEGPWKTDPRAEVVRFLLEYGEGVSTRSIASMTSAIPDAPEAVLARTHLRAGDFDAAEEIERQTPAAGSSEWLPYYVELARAHIAARRLGEAGAALERIAPATRRNCDVLLALRDLAGARRDDAERIARDAEIASTQTASIQDWTSQSPRSVCVDPNRFGSSVTIDVRAPVPSLVTYGWVGGQLGRAMVDGDGSIRFPRGNVQGRRAVFLSSNAPDTVWRVHHD